MTTEHAAAYEAQPAKLELRDILKKPELLALYEQGFIEETPTVRLRSVGNANLHLKLEHLQSHANSFKIRGAANALLRAMQERPDQLKQHGVVIASAGNAGAGAAIVGRRLGLDVTVLAPPKAPRCKKDLIQRWGGKLDTNFRNVDAALRAAEKFAAQTGAFLLPPFDHPDVLDGQSTVGYELYAQLPSVKKVFAGFGGGSLTTGLGLALHEFNAGTEVYGVTLAPENDPTDRFINIEDLPAKRDFNPHADGTAVSQRASVIWPETQQHVRGILQVAPWRLGAALTELDFQTPTSHVEMAGALGFAGMLLYAETMQELVHEPEDWAAVLSGGNRLNAIIEQYKELYAKHIHAQNFLGEEALKLFK